eukprot:CAMPEP_0116134840 /NCGR_PEP_ID=MMETSP0329-20121206/10865_1 /TAXON_ID=697910 /ORGANISM="Pseudo-nitzschia arenysensis, Strain B593" /LENGTH=192 /DNA_ID=CAMNT_0003629587 /DNA_START=188 /DNA_END=766 /DNA_ORIENTATION=+
MAAQQRQDPPTAISAEEAQLRATIALLEKEAEAKKKAADAAIEQANKALEEANMEQEALAKKAMNGSIAAIAQMIAVAEQEAEIYASVSDAVEAREISSLEGPPAIVRQEDPQEATNNISPLRQASSLLGMNDPLDERHVETMETTLDTLMDKIEECTSILSNPNATVEEHITAAKLATEYAKAAKAFQSAM